MPMAKALNHRVVEVSGDPLALLEVRHTFQGLAGLVVLEFTLACAAKGRTTSMST